MTDQEHTSLADTIAAFFAEDGPLAEVLPGYRPRAPQLEMALAVGEALETPGARLVVEAGTGTGKSLAYLVPALLSGQQVCVATGTKALQDQLFGKDLPMVLGAVSDFVGQEKTAALMKGRQNYLCITRWEQFNQSPAFAFAEEARHYERLKHFVETTQVGDRAEIDGLPEPFSTWSDLDAGSETCVGQQCPAYNDCFVTKMRRTAEKADVVVVNHHLLCADLRVRLEAKAAAGQRADPSLAQVIPDVQAVILDEAHALPDIATDYFGVHFATGRADRLASDIGRHTTKQRKDVVTALGNAMNRYEMAFEKMLERIGPPATAAERVELAETLADDETVALREQMVSALADVCNRLEGLAEIAEDKSQTQNELIGLSRRAEQIAFELGFLLDQALTDKSFVTWLEGKRRGFSLSAAPIDVGGGARGDPARRSSSGGAHIGDAGGGGQHPALRGACRAAPRAAGGRRRARRGRGGGRGCRRGHRGRRRGVRRPAGARRALAVVDGAAVALRLRAPRGALRAVGHAEPQGGHVLRSLLR